MRQKAVLPKGPEMGIKCLNALIRSSLDHRAPATLQRFFEQDRKHPLDRLALQVIKKYFRHCAVCGSIRGALSAANAVSRKISPPARLTGGPRIPSPSSC